MKTRFIFITGGVVSSLGKGITAASIGLLLKSRGLSVINQKFDPYLNIDPGTMNPYQHGEVYVTADGAETDLNLDKYGLPASFELIRKANPDVIFVIDRSSAVGEKSQSASQVLDNPLIHQTRAWQKGQIVYLSGTAFTAGGGIRQIQQDLTTIKQSFEKTD